MQLLSKNKLGKYFIYAIGEIFLVVIGILIALWINNWNNESIAKKEEEKSYLNIKQQVVDDRKEVVKVKDLNNYYYSIYDYATKIIIAQDRTKVDSLALFAMGLSRYSDFNRNGKIYETLVNSGELQLLENTDITSAIQQLETTYIYVNKLEDMHWELIMTELSPELKGVINYANLQTLQPEKLYSIELQNIFFEIMGLCKMKDTDYGAALNDIDTIVGFIDKELNSSGFEQLNQ